MKKQPFFCLLYMILISAVSLFADDTLYCIANYEFQTPMPEYKFVTTVSLGDINADGYDDWSLLFHDFNQFQKNDTAWIYLGNDTIDFTSDYSIRANDIAPLGDVNRDGFADIGYLDVRTWGSIYIYKPKLYILYGGRNFDLIPDDSCIINVDGYKVKLSRIGGLGDVNRDGYDDIHCGVSEKWEYYNESKQYIFFGGEDISTNADITLPPPNRIDLTNEYYSFGEFISAIGDVNNDLYDDFVISYNDGMLSYNEQSRIYVYYGSSNPDSILGKIDTLNFNYFEQFSTMNNLDIMHKSVLFMSRPPNMDIFNTQDALKLLHFDNYKEVSTTNGDINNDGFNDWFILLGDPDFYKGYYGSGNLDSLYDIVLPNDEQPNTHDYRQLSCSFIGNVCGDGYDKLLVIESDGIHTDHTGNPDLRYNVYCYSYNNVLTDMAPLKPHTFTLTQNYPNPFNPVTMISYQLPANNDVDLSIYDIAGKKVVTLVNDHLKAGNYDTIWNAARFSSGIYIARLSYGEMNKSIKMLLLK